MEDKIEKDIENEIEKKIEKWFKDRVGGVAEVVGNIIAIICSLVFIFIVHNLTKWDFRILDFIIKDDFNKILWAFDLSICITIFTRLIRIFLPNKLIKSAMQIIDNIFSAILMIVTLIVFPYDFRELISISWINGFVKIITGLIIFGIFTGTIVEFVKMLRYIIFDK